MGFTPLDGLVMATRSGSVDPGMLLWLLERERLTERELAQSLEHESGLAGIAGTADMREILRRAGAGDDTARLALDVYIHRLRSLIAAMAAAMGGIDVLVFTGGVGEHSAEVRSLRGRRARVPRRRARRRPKRGRRFRRGDRPERGRPSGRLW